MDTHAQPADPQNVLRKRGRKGGKRNWHAALAKSLRSLPAYMYVRKHSQSAYENCNRSREADAALSKRESYEACVTCLARMG